MNQNTDESETKEISLTPVLTTIFKPTGKLLGKELKKYVENKIDKYKEKKQEQNIEYHLKEVRKLINKSSRNSKNNETFSQVALFSDWLEGAKDIPPEEPELSKIWQRILLDISSGKNIRKNLIKKLKSIDGHEAKILLKTTKKGYIRLLNNNKEDEYSVKSLVEKGILERKIIIPLFNILLITLIVLLIFWFPQNLDKLFDFRSVEEIENIVRKIVFMQPFVGVAWLGFVYYKVRRFLRVFYLTWIGEELVKYSGHNK